MDDEKKMIRVLTRVRCWGDVIVTKGKLVCTHREVVEVIHE